MEPSDLEKWRAHCHDSRGEGSGSRTDLGGEGSGARLGQWKENTVGRGSGWAGVEGSGRRTGGGR